MLDIDWSIEMISANKLYEPILHGDKKDGGEEVYLENQLYNLFLKLY